MHNAADRILMTTCQSLKYFTPKTINWDSAIAPTADPDWLIPIAVDLFWKVNFYTNSPVATEPEGQVCVFENIFLILTLSKYIGMIKVLALYTMLFPIPKQRPIATQNHSASGARVLASNPTAWITPPKNRTNRIPNLFINTLVTNPPPSAVNLMREKARPIVECVVSKYCRKYFNETFQI